jgi:hypothetical protein
MNTEQINRFDELMRDKLNSYEETDPNMDLLVQIHARKNRFLRLRNLYTLIVIIAIFSASSIGFYYLLGDKHSKQKSPVNQKEFSKPAKSSIYDTDYYSNKKKNSILNAKTGSVVNGNSSPIHTNKNNSVISKNNSKSDYSNSINIQQLPESTVVSNQKTKNSVEELKLCSNKSTQIKTTGSKNNVEQTAKADENDSKSDTKQLVDACKVDIDYYTTYDNGFNFIARSQNPNIQLTWLFGDGKSSREQSPKHVYQKAGQYAVTLTAIDKRTKCKAEAYTIVQVKQGANLSSSTISGTVFADAEYAAKTRVDLLIYNNTTNVYELAQSAFTNNNGFYEFNEIIEGNYLIKTANYKEYTASYYGNTTDREYANSIAIFANDYKELTGYDIQLTNYKLSVLNNTEITDTSNSKWMLVFDQNNNPVASVLVNAEGKIQSSVNLPNGNYNLMDPSTGKSTGKLNVAADGSIVGATNLKAGKSNGLDTEPMQELVLMPNPATDYVKVSLNPFNSKPILVKIVNSQGALVQSMSLENGSEVNNISISTLPVGTYYVVVSQNGVTTSSRLVKTFDSSR